MIPLIKRLKETLILHNTLQDQLTLQENRLYLTDVFGETYPLPNLTGLWHLYQSTTNQTIRQHIKPILEEDLGTLLVVEIMIDASHEVTLKRLASGEIQKNMKHVHDYYIIPKSHYALAKAQFEKTHQGESFNNCHFAMFPYGLAILRAAFPEYHNLYTSTATLTAGLS